MSNNLKQYNLTMKNLKLNNISVNTIFFFLLKIWFLTNIASAFLFVPINDYHVNDSINATILFEKTFWQGVFFVTFIGLVYSIPAMVILGLIIKIFTHNKLILVLISVLLVVITFYFTGSIALKNTKTYIPTPPIIYSLVVSILILIIKIEKNKIIKASVL